MRKRTIDKNNVFGFDCEGDAGERGFHCASVVGENEHIFSYDCEDIIKFMLDRAYDDVVMVATNLEYDLSVIFQGQLDMLKLFYADDRLLYAKFDLDGTKLEFWDTIRAVGPFSVEKLGKMVGVEKLPTPNIYLDGLKESPSWFCEKHEVEQCPECYNIQDSAISRLGFLLFVETVQHLNGSVKKTIASTAINLWRQYVGRKREISLPHMLDPLCREAYYGGRTEVFTYGEVLGLNQYDVNSLYPYVMYKYLYPDMSRLTASESIKKIDEIKNCYGVVNVDLVVPEMKIPPLPYRYDGKLVFPVGEFSGTYTIHELMNAMRFGVRIKKINWAVYSDKAWSPFSDFISDLYEKRLEFKAENNPMEGAVKTIMNSTYGKYGQKLGGEIGWLVPLRPEHMEHIEDFNKFYPLGGVFWVQEPLEDMKSPFYLNVLWAAYITSYARMELYDLFEACNFDVHYCDTDSVYTTHELPSSKDLGDVKLEGSDLRCIFLAPKFYKVVQPDGVEKYAIKGAPAPLMAAYFTGQPISFRVPVKIKLGIRHGEIPGSWKSITRQFHNEFDKRRLDPRFTKGLTGNCATSPLVLVNGIPEDAEDARTESMFDLPFSPSDIIRSFVSTSST